MLYMEGADPSTANSPPGFRCPRHLHTGCEICVEAKSTPRPGLGARGPSSDLGSKGSQWKGVTPDNGGITGWQDGSGIGSGLARPAAGGSVLRRKNPFGEEKPGSGGGNTKLSELIPRFFRISALVASELGREVRGEEESTSTSSSPPKEGAGGTSPVWQNSLPKVGAVSELTPLPEPSSPTVIRAVAQAQDRMYAYALRPSREWYMLLAGLLTRAALEGYLTAHWRGSDAVECLLTCGLSVVDSVRPDGEQSEEEEDKFADMDPDELPNLVESVKVLFPGTRNNVGQGKSKAEEEFEKEMDERLRRVRLQTFK